MGDRVSFLRNAAVSMEAQGIRIEKKSSLYETAPWGMTDQADFLNAVIQAEWNGEPEELMRRLLRIEQEQGRTRLVHWGPRTLDLDVIWGEHIISDSALLRLPHPFFWERAFVLVPMAEIAPGFSYRGQTIETRISELDSEKMVRRTEWDWEDDHGAGKEHS